MAARIVRQTNKIVLLGAPSSAAAMSAGHEAAPQSLRAAGLADRLRASGYNVVDLGDDVSQVFKPDNESPRARNLPAVLKSLESLKPRVEEAVKSGGLPVILGGDCSVILAVVAGARRYFRRVGLVYMDRDADLFTPATTQSGCVDGMVVSHLTGRGAAELVRFWGEPPLVREPDLALFGIERIEPVEEEVLRRSTMRSYTAVDVRNGGAAAFAERAVSGIHGDATEFIVLLDVDVIGDFPATNYPASGGLTIDDVRAALEVFVKRKNLAAIAVTAYNPAKDPEGTHAKAVVDLLAGALDARLQALTAAASESSSAAKPDSSGAIPETAAAPAADRSPVTVAGEAWSSDALETDSPPDSADATAAAGESVESDAAAEPERSASSQETAENAPETESSGV